MKDKSFTHKVCACVILGINLLCAETCAGMGVNMNESLTPHINPVELSHSNHNNKLKARIDVYPMPFIYSESSVYQVKVNGIEIPVVDCNVDYDYANFSMSEGEATIEITTQDNITEYTITPQKLCLKGFVDGNSLTFTISRDIFLIITFPGLKRLVITPDVEETDKPASSGKGIFNVLSEEYKADPTNTILTTHVMQKAIDDASTYGSIKGNPHGIVYIPAGVYKISNLALKSNVDLYLEGGSVLLASYNRVELRSTVLKNPLEKILLICFIQRIKHRMEHQWNLLILKYTDGVPLMLTQG